MWSVDDVGREKRKKNYKLRRKKVSDVLSSANFFNIQNVSTAIAFKFPAIFGQTSLNSFSP